MGNNNVKFRLLKGELLQFAILDEKPIIPANDTSFQCKVNINYNPVSRIVRSEVECCFHREEYVMAKAAGAMYFELEEKTAKAMTLGTEITIPQLLLAYFASLTFGALRGMCITKAQDSGKNFPILPPTDFNQVITQPAIFSIDSPS